MHLSQYSHPGAPIPTSCPRTPIIMLGILHYFSCDVAMLLEQFENARVECKRCLDENLPLPAYDYCLMASHTFNVLDARKAISVTQRQNYILKIRELAKGCALKYKEVVDATS